MMTAEKGLIPNGSLFSDAKHCFRSFRNELNVELFYNTFLLQRKTNKHIVNVKYNRLLL